jgi:hypothetical protein
VALVERGRPAADRPLVDVADVAPSRSSFPVPSRCGMDSNPPPRPAACTPPARTDSLDRYTPQGYLVKATREADPEVKR